MVFQAFFLYRLYPSVQLVFAVCCHPFAEHARAISVFSYDEIYLLQLCLHPDLSLLTLSLREMPIIRLWNLWCAASSFFFCARVSGHDSAPYNIVDITADSYDLTLSVVLICLCFHTDFSLQNTLLALLILVWQSLLQLLLLVT